MSMDHKLIKEVSPPTNFEFKSVLDFASEHDNVFINQGFDVNTGKQYYRRQENFEVPKVDRIVKNKFNCYQLERGCGVKEVFTYYKVDPDGALEVVNN